MKKPLVFVLVAAIPVAPALAILGVGDIVYDPANFEQAVQQVAQLEQQYFQLVQTYGMIENQYRQMLRMARQIPVSMATRYRGVGTPWTPSSAPDTLGNTAAWTTGINSGLNVPAAYAGVTETLDRYEGALGNVPADQLDRVKTSYATVELTDGANLSAMRTIGQLRSNAPAVENAIQNLENDSLSSDPDMNTEIGVLNKMSAAHVLALRNSQDTNKLLVALAEAQLLKSKRERDAEARAVNDHIRFMSEGQAVMAAQSADASAAMQTWRMP